MRSARRPTEFVPGVGIKLKRNTEVRVTNLVDFSTVSRTNSLGFLDREPPAPEQAWATCHVAFVGDSFVEAGEVRIADKSHVQLERLVAERLPQLDVTTSAWGRIGLGQIAQLPYYDKWIRRLRPKLVVLVFVHNDFTDNSNSSQHPPTQVAAKEADGRIVLRPPDPDYAKFRRARPDPSAWEAALLRSYWASAADWRRERARHSVKDSLPAGPEFTAFALDLWQGRVEPDGVALAVLATHRTGTRGDVVFEAVAALAETRGIAVIDQTDWILRRGGAIEDVHWEHDHHWNVRGHRWAAEAVFEWLEQRHQAVCGE